VNIGPVVVCIALVSLAAGAPSPHARGPRQPGPPENGSAPASSTEETARRSPATLDPEAVLSRTLERLALMDLRLQPYPGPDDYAIADAILEMAEDLGPPRVQIARRRAALAYRIGDREALERATRRIVKLDPDDTVAQLRLITRRIGSLQTVEQRLAAFDRFLGDGARSLDPSVRSRLALDAALLARERGDDDAFVRYLTQATQLDSTNKEAAALAVAYFHQRLPGDPVGRAELIVNLLLADVLDPNVHLSLARQFALHGAFEQAARFHANGRGILFTGSGRRTEQLVVERLVLDWFVRGPAAPAEELDTEIAVSRADTKERLEALVEQGIPIDGETPPESVRLRPTLERIRILAAHAVGDSELVTEALDDLGAGHTETLQKLTDPETRPEDLTDEQARERAGAFLLDQLMLRIFTSDQVDRFVQAVRGSRLYQVETVREAAAPWLALHDERYEEAIAGFERLGSNIPTNWLGIALAHEGAGRVDRAVEAYRRTFQLAPLSPYGAWALHRAERLIGVDPSRTTHTGPMAELAREVPGWVDEAARDPVTTTNLIVEGPSRSLGPLEPGWVRLKLRNAAPAPLGLGADHTIRSTFVVVPSFSVPGAEGEQRAFPEILELDQRLRLRSQEVLEVTVQADPAFTGWFLETASDTPTRVRYRVIQGVQTDGTALRVGPLSVAAEVPAHLRSPLKLALEGPQAVADALRERPEQDLAEPFAAVRTLALRGDRLGIASGDLQPVVDALIERFDSLGPVPRALCLAIVPHWGMAPALARFDRHLPEVLAGERDPLVLGVALATRADAPGDPIFGIPGIEDGRRIATLSRLLRERLEDGRPGYATAGTDLDDLTPFRVRGEPSE